MDCNLKQIPCGCLNEEYSLLYKLDMNTSEHFNDFYKQIYKSISFQWKKCLQRFTSWTNLVDTLVLTKLKHVFLKYVTCLTFRLFKSINKNPLGNKLILYPSNKIVNIFCIAKCINVRKLSLQTIRPYRVGVVVSVSASHTVGRESASRPGHTKDHNENGTNCLSA